MILVKSAHGINLSVPVLVVGGNQIQVYLGLYLL